MEDTSADVFLPSARFARFSDFAAFGDGPFDTGRQFSF